MNLIPINTAAIGGLSQQTVNARELHGFLQVGKDFSNWIKDRIEKYGFQENQDFEVFANSGDNPLGGRPALEYHLTLDMAKELAMVEKNAQGRQARQYFIECEKQLRQIDEYDARQAAHLKAQNEKLVAYVNHLESGLVKKLPIAMLSLHGNPLRVFLHRGVPHFVAEDIARLAGRDIDRGVAGRSLPLSALCAEYGVTPQTVRNQMGLNNSSNYVTCHEISDLIPLPVTLDMEWFMAQVSQEIVALYRILMNVDGRSPRPVRHDVNWMVAIDPARGGD
jgi:phage anti-repressor protein